MTAHDNETRAGATTGPQRPTEADSPGVYTPQPPDLSPEEDPLEVLRAYIRRVSAVPELPMRAPLAGQLAEAMSPEVGAFVIDQLVRMTVTGVDVAYETLMAVAAWLLRDRSSYQWRRDVYTLSVESTMECTPRFLIEIPPRQVVHDARSLRRPHFDRDVTLGERKSMARTRDRDLLERLLLDTDPQVVAKLCLNPAVNEQDILSIATRRPNIPEALHTLALSYRWLVNYPVRRAIVHNPYANTGLALKLLPFLHGKDIRRVARSRELHDALTETASNLLVIRRKKAALKP